MYFPKVFYLKSFNAVIKQYKISSSPFCLQNFRHIFQQWKIKKNDHIQLVNVSFHLELHPLDFLYNDYILPASVWLYIRLY